MQPIRILVLAEKGVKLPFSFKDEHILIGYQDIAYISEPDILLFAPDLLVFNASCMDSVSASLENIIRNQLLKEVPLICLFYDFSKESYVNALKCGAVDVIFYPVKEEYILSKIKSLMQTLDIHKSNDNFLSQGKLSGFIKKTIDVIKMHLNNPCFSVEDLAEHMALSRVQLYRNIKKDTNRTASEFIRYVRLNEAIQILKNEDDRISEIAYKVGFENPSYFTSCFKREFGITPSQYIN